MAMRAVTTGTGGRGHVPWKVRNLNSGFIFAQCHIKGLLQRKLFNFIFIKASPVYLNTELFFM